MAGCLPHVCVMIDSSKISSILQGKIPDLEIPPGIDSGKPDQESFAELLAKGIDSVRELAEKRDDLTVDLALGKPVELHQVMLATTKAQVAMELLIELRNKLIEAYQEISRMPV